MINYTALPLFKEILTIVQEDVASKYSKALIDVANKTQLRSYISNCIRQRRLHLPGVDSGQLADILYNEMAEASFITELLKRDDIEEININSWDDIVVTYTDGRIEQLGIRFMNPQHATDVIKRLLKLSDGIIDDANSLAQGHLPNNARVTAIKTPVVDSEVGISASIRLLHPNRVTRTQLTSGGTCTQEMLDFMCMCLSNGISFVVVGATSSGKTTLLNCLLGTIPDHKRVFVIESGTRELSLVRRSPTGYIENNVVSTLTSVKDDEKFTIDQEDLVVASLRFSPNIIVVGEMRDSEAHAAVEASLTGHTVVTTVHAGSAQSAHTRIALLMQKKYPIDFDISLMQAVEAFPLVIYEQRIDDNSRKIMDIAEVTADVHGNRTFRTLYRYAVDNAYRENGRTHVDGHFEKPNKISDDFKDRLIRGGAPLSEIERFTSDGEYVPVEDTSYVRMSREDALNTSVDYSDFEIKVDDLN